MKKKLISKIVNPLLVFTILTFMAILMANQPAIHVLADNDTTPPVTEISFTTEDWQKEDIALTLNCTDNVGCDKTYYCVDIDDVCDPTTEYTATFAHTTEGTSYIRFNSIDTSQNEEEVNSQILNLDKTLPSITITTPTNGQQISGTTFIIEGTSSDSVSGIEKVEIEINGETFDVVGTENWQFQWQDFGDGSYTITAKAIDNAGNEEISSISVTVDNPPSGRIVSISDPPLVKAGRIEVELQTSEPVQFTPTLSYSIGGGEGNIQIPLDGSSQTWRGFMFITENHHDKIGTFEFSATDFNSNIGNTITQGSFFVVDSISPHQVASIEVEVEDDDIELSWFYEGEELRQFNVYRSKKSNVDYINYYKTVPKDSTTTKDDLDGKTYHYRIAAVDLAGNIGELSEEVSGTSGEETQSEQAEQTSTTEQQTINNQKLSNQLLRKIDGVILKVDEQISEIEKAKLNLQKDPASEEIRLNAELNNARAGLEDYTKKLEALRKGDRSISEIEEELQKISLKVHSILINLPKDIQKESEINFVQDVSLQDIEEIVTILKSDLTQKERDSYITRTQRLQRKLEVKVTAEFFKVLLFEGDRYVTLIKKEVITSAENSQVIESVPKTIAESASKINIITQDHEILKDDPIIGWKPGTENIKYSINKKLSENELRDVNTIILPDETTSPGFFTGLAVYGRSAIATISDFKIIIGIVMLALLLVFYFTYLRDGEVRVYKEVRKNYDPYVHHRTHENKVRKKYRHDYRQPQKTRRVDFGEYTKPLSNNQQRQVQSISLIERDDSFNHFMEMVDKSNGYADEGRFSLASKSYSLLLELYNVLNPNYKKEAHKRILHVYNKLNLYSKIKEMEIAEIVNLNMNNQNLLEHIAELYSVISKAEKGKSTKLLRFARNYYNFSLSKFRR